MGLLSESRGTRACIVVPPSGSDSTENVPFRSFSRSSILMRPSPSALLYRFAVKAYAGVVNHKMNLIRRSRQLHLDVPNPTVFRRIVEGFLENSEKAKRNVRRQRTGQIVG